MCKKRDISWVVIKYKIGISDGIYKVVVMEELVWFNQFGKRVEGYGENHYCAPLVVKSGIDVCGVDHEVYLRLKFEYPSLQYISNHDTQTTHGVTHGVFIVNLPGVYSHRDERKVRYDVIIDVRNFPHHKPQAYVFTPSDENIAHCNIYHAKMFSIWPNKPLCAICEGMEGNYWDSIKGDNYTRLATWLNQVLQTLNTPNSEDAARCVE